jgi:hypothetical protein
MNRISDFQILKLRTGQFVLQYVLRKKNGKKAVHRVFASSKMDAIGRILQITGFADGG